MKTCVLSESTADEAAVRILVAALLGNPTEPVGAKAVVARGWSSGFAILPAVLRELHFHTDAEALVVVVDSDNSTVHDPAHEEPGKADEECRLCALRSKVDRTRLRQVPSRAGLKVAIGLAVPAVEAWYLCGRERMVSEAE